MNTDTTPNPSAPLAGAPLRVRWHQAEPWRRFTVERFDSRGLRIRIADRAPDGKRWNLRSIPHGAAVELTAVDGDGNTSAAETWVRAGATGETLTLRRPA